MNLPPNKNLKLSSSFAKATDGQVGAAPRPSEFLFEKSLSLYILFVLNCV